MDSLSLACHPGRMSLSFSSDYHVKIIVPFHEVYAGHVFPDSVHAQIHVKTKNVLALFRENQTVFYLADTIRSEKKESSKTLLYSNDQKGLRGTNHSGWKTVYPTPDHLIECQKRRKQGVAGKQLDHPILTWRWQTTDERDFTSESWSMATDCRSHW